MKRFTSVLCVSMASMLLLLFAVAMQGCAANSKQLDNGNSKSTAKSDAAERARLIELDAYWAKVSKAVNQGDFESYKATCHDQGILVSTAGTKKTSQPLSQALARWKKEFDATKAGTMKASATFRFSQRVGDDTTAHETGILLYTQLNAEGKRIHDYVHVQALLIKQAGQWKIIMEYQKAKATKQDWERLPKMS
jgi:hypothetical protein